jgi:small subunit ribosomal protein S20
MTAEGPQKPDAEKKSTKRSSAKKRELQDKERRLRNRAFRSKIRTAVRFFRENVQGAKQEENRTRLAEIFSLVDKGVNKAVLKRNAANRVKSRLRALLQA